MNTALSNRRRKKYFDLHPHNRIQNKKRIEAYFEQINSLLIDSGNNIPRTFLFIFKF
jgi:hypothetical protein